MVSRWYHYENRTLRMYNLDLDTFKRDGKLLKQSMIALFYKCLDIATTLYLYTKKGTWQRLGIWTHDSIIHLLAKRIAQVIDSEPRRSHGGPSWTASRRLKRSVTHTRKSWMWNLTFKKPTARFSAGSQSPINDEITSFFVRNSKLTMRTRVRVSGFCGVRSTYNGRTGGIRGNQFYG